LHVWDGWRLERYASSCFNFDSSPVESLITALHLRSSDHFAFLLLWIPRFGIWRKQNKLFTIKWVARKFDKRMCVCDLPDRFNIRCEYTKTWRYHLLHKHYTPHMYVIIQHLYFTQTLLSVTFHNTCHPTDNKDASRENATRTFSHNTRRETVTGHTPPTHVTDD
jgi:hypothetical protein